MGPALGSVCTETESRLGIEIARCKASLHKLSNSDQMTETSLSLGCVCVPTIAEHAARSGVAMLAQLKCDFAANNNGMDT